jgi:hypothetical protein
MQFCVREYETQNLSAIARMTAICINNTDRANRRFAYHNGVTLDRTCHGPINALWQHRLGRNLIRLIV